MIHKIDTVKEWLDANRADSVLTSKIVVAIDDDEPIKQKIIDIFQRHRPDIGIYDMNQVVFDDLMDNRKLAKDVVIFKAPGCVFCRDGIGVWGSMLNFLSLEDDAWNNMILHNMLKKFYPQEEEDQ